MKKFLSKHKLTSIFMALLLLVFPFLTYAQGTTAKGVETLAEFKEAVSGETGGGDIRLDSDITLDEIVEATKSISLDLNGHTLNISSYRLRILADAEIKDTSTDQTGEITGTGVYKIQVGKSTGPQATLTFTSGKLSGTQYGIYVTKNSALIVDGGEISAPSGAIVNGSGSVTINGGDISSNGATGGYTIYNTTNATIEMNDGKVSFKDKAGTAIYLLDGSTATINGGVIEALISQGTKSGYGIGAFKNTNVTINGGEITANGFALSGNGTINPAEPNYGANAKFTITGGTLTSTAANGAAIYAPQPNGKTVISGGTITGESSALEIRAGELTITGGTFTGNQETYNVDPNHNGNTTIGSAVSVKQHTTKQPIDVNISGGTFYGKVPFSESNPQGNQEEDLRKITYDISGGIFHSTDSEKTVDVEDMYNGKFIWGGKYTHWVTDYVKDGYGEKPENNMIAVYKWCDVNLSQSANGETTVTRNKTISDDGTTIVTEPDQTSDTQVH